MQSRDKDYIIDLHGVKHKDVPEVIDRYIYQNRNIALCSYEIITGNSPTMKNIVTECVSRYGFKTKEVHWNSGMLIAYQ